MLDLSILIFAQDEQSLGNIIQNIANNIEGNTEIIVVLDGCADVVPKLPKDPRIKTISLPRTIGQNAGVFLAAKVSEAKYVMTADINSVFEKGFDAKIVREIIDGKTIKSHVVRARDKFLDLEIGEVKSQQSPTKSIIYYTDNRLDEKIMKRCQEQLMKVESPSLPIISVSLEPIQFGQNYTVNADRGYLTVTKQIIKGLEESISDVVFFCEHDVLYHPSHFDFTPAAKDVFYYNTNSWMLRAEDGHCLYYDHRSLSGMSCYRETALVHFRKRKERIEALLKEAGDIGKVKATSGTTISLKEGIHRLGFEPGTHNRPEKIDDLQAEDYRSEFPNVDIRHKNNLTQNRFRKDQFRNARSYAGWTESDSIPGWGKGKDII